MKAITIWQPWASLIACGVKKYETRSWATKYRGPIAIHSALKPFVNCWSWSTSARAREVILRRMGLTEDFEPEKYFPPGCILATAELVNVWYIVHHPGTNIDVAKGIPVGAESVTTDKHAPDFGDFFVPSSDEMTLGDWTPGRYAWELRNVKPLSAPVQAMGRQGLWNWEIDI